ncbi:MAG TPA: hypothetical protein VNW97_13640 [Candidatus Saccharimonadales bacterium]|nr:hypothetical protein [Candidatus Saccharimonadales bacterium]
MANSWSDLPLAINMIGPMAFKQNGVTLDVWFPKLEEDFKHQAGIGTNLNSFIFDGKLREFTLLDPNPPQYASTTAAYYPSSYDRQSNGTNQKKVCSPYFVEPKKYEPTSYFIHLTLPRPKWMIGLNPVSCMIYENGKSTTSNYQLRPVGFRLLYERAGVPVLTSDLDRKFSYYPPFDPAPEEKQLEMFINYVPFVYTGGDGEAEDDFKRLGDMLDLKLKLKIEPPGKQVPLGPLHNCKSANIILF